MKKFLAVFLAVCLFASLLPMTVMAANPSEVKVKFYNGTAPDFTLTIPSGSTCYVVEDSNKELIQHTGASAPSNKFIKFELSGVSLNVTFNNVNVDLAAAGGYTCHGIWFQSGDYDVNINLVGNNSLTHGNSSSIKFENTGDITISGSGSMEVTQNAAASGAIWCAGGGNLTIKNTTMSFAVTPPSSTAKHHAIFMSKGSTTIEGSTITSQTSGGQLVFFGTADIKTGRYTLDTDTSRKLIIKNSEITAKGQKCIFETAAPATIENSTVKMTLSGSSGPTISPAPTFKGDYTAIAGLAKNADKLDKLKVFDAKKLSSYTYVYIVPGIVELLPTEPTTPTTAPTRPTLPPATEPEYIPPIATAPAETWPDAPAPVETWPVETAPVESRPVIQAPDVYYPDGNDYVEAPTYNNYDSDDYAEVGTKHSGIKILGLGLPILAIAGLGLGLLFFILIIIFVILLIFLGKKKKK